MLANKSALEVMKNNKLYQLILPPEASIMETKEVLQEMFGFCEQRMENILKAQEEAKNASEEAVEAVSEEVSE